MCILVHGCLEAFCCGCGCAARYLGRNHMLPSEEGSVHMYSIVLCGLDAPGPFHFDAVILYEDERRAAHVSQQGACESRSRPSSYGTSPTDSTSTVPSCQLRRLLSRYDLISTRLANMAVRTLNFSPSHDRAPKHSSRESDHAANLTFVTLLRLPTLRADIRKPPPSQPASHPLPRRSANVIAIRCRGEPKTETKLQPSPVLSATRCQRFKVQARDTDAKLG